VLGLVGDLRAEEGARLVRGGGDRERQQLGGHALLAEEERAEAPEHELALEVREPVALPVGLVLTEVERLGVPLLVLPAGEQLLVGRRGLDDPVEPGHDLVDVRIQQYVECVELFGGHVCHLTFGYSEHY
jgi:hypothetical protein